MTSCVPSTETDGWGRGSLDFLLSNKSGFGVEDLAASNRGIDAAQGGNICGGNGVEQHEVSQLPGSMVPLDKVTWSRSAGAVVSMRSMHF